MEKVATMMPQLEKMLPKLDSILGSLNTVLADPAIPATLHNVQNLTANLAVTSGQLQTLMNKDIPQLTGKLNTIGDKLCSDFQQPERDRLRNSHAKHRLNAGQREDAYRQIKP